MTRWPKFHLFPITREMIPGIGWVTPAHPLHPDHKMLVNMGTPEQIEREKAKAMEALMRGDYEEVTDAKD